MNTSTICALTNFAAFGLGLIAGYLWAYELPEPLHGLGEETYTQQNKVDDPMSLDPYHYPNRDCLMTYDYGQSAFMPSICYDADTGEVIWDRMNSSS